MKELIIVVFEVVLANYFEITEKNQEARLTH